MALVQYDNEYSRLRKIALYKPHLDEIDQGDPGAAMYIETPDPFKVLEEFEGIVAKFRELGVEVVVLESHNKMPSTNNMIFLRDVAFVFRNNIIIANMKHPLRQAEPDKFKAMLMSQDAGYEECFTDLNKSASMEGADIFALNNKLLCIYAGSRTSANVAEMLQEKFDDLATKIIKANIHGVPQHILGGVHILDYKIATRRTRYCTDNMEGYKFIDFDENAEIKSGFALNIVTLSPKEILMPANNPAVKKVLEADGVICHEVEVKEIHKMGGGLACMVLPLFREQPNVN